jgi:hypothetical protein
MKYLRVTSGALELVEGQSYVIEVVQYILWCMWSHFPKGPCTETSSIREPAAVLRLGGERVHVLESESQRHCFAV